jgi:hypothetical protein
MSRRGLGTEAGVVRIWTLSEIAGEDRPPAPDESDELTFPLEPELEDPGDQTLLAGTGEHRKPAPPAKSARPARPPQPKAGPKHWQLRVVKADKSECVLPLEDEPITIGRRREHSVVPDCSQVSRDHARIWLDESGPRVKDLGSRNGTLVNGIKVPSASLNMNDVVTIGSLMIFVEEASRNNNVSR